MAIKANMLKGKATNAKNLKKESTKLSHKVDKRSSEIKIDFSNRLTILTMKK